MKGRRMNIQLRSREMRARSLILRHEISIAIQEIVQKNHRVQFDIHKPFVVALYNCSPVKPVAILIEWGTTN